MSANHIAMKATAGGPPLFNVPKVAYLIAFAVVSLLAYGWGAGGRSATTPCQPCTATALVRLHADPANRPANASLDSNSVRRQILSQANVARAARQVLGTETPAATQEGAVMEAMSRLQAKLAVQMAVTDAAGGWQLSLKYTDDNPRAAAQWVNGLACSYADGYRQQWRSQAETASHDAHEATNRAAEQLRQATAGLDAFVEQQWQQSQQNPSQTTQSTQTAAANSSLVDNPAWLDLSRQLGILEQRRAHLLVNCTPIHPEVQETESRLADLRRQLAETERWIPARHSDAASSAAVPTNRQMVAPTDVPATLKKLQQGVAEASRAHDAATRAERAAWQTCQQEPQIDLELAQIQAAVPSWPGRLRLALAALVAGLPTTVGLGMIATGAAMQPTVDSLAQLSAMLTVPVLGILPETNPARTTRLGRSKLVRTLWIVIGLLVTTSCLAAMLLTGK